MPRSCIFLEATLIRVGSGEYARQNESYGLHPEILSSYIEGSLLLQMKDEAEAELRDGLPRLRPEEAAVLTLLQQRLGLTLKDKLIASAARAA